MKKNNKRGFTLAELLIVVAIIAVLVAVAIPVFTSQLEKSRDGVSVSNIRAAYAEATTELLTWDGEATSFSNANIKSITKGEDGITTVIVQNVAIKSQVSTDDWSGLAKELPADTKPSDPGKAGKAEVTFKYDTSGKCTSITVGTPS